MSDNRNSPKKPLSNKAKNIPVINLTVNTGISQIGSGDTQKKESDTQDGNITVTVINEPNSDSHQITANDIAAISNKIANKAVWVNIGLFFGTLILAIIGTCQYKSSQSSAEIAKQTLDSVNAFNKRMYNLQIAANENASATSIKRDSNDAKTFKLQDSSLNAQIKSLRESQQEFEIENRPFVGVVNFRTNALSIGQKFNTSAMITNTGKQPAYIIISKCDFIQTIDSSYSNLKGTNKPAVNKDVYIANGEFFPVFSGSEDIINEANIKYYKVNKLFVFLKGEITYRGFAKNKIYNLSFLIRLEADEEQHSKTIYYKTN